SLSMFFVSSRRRHTSFSRDWSSDVCSSDLKLCFGGEGADTFYLVSEKLNSIRVFTRIGKDIHDTTPYGKLSGFKNEIGHLESIRSEERRVGKECRYRTSTYHEIQPTENART